MAERVAERQTTVVETTAEQTNSIRRRLGKFAAGAAAVSVLVGGVGAYMANSKHDCGAEIDKGGTAPLRDYEGETIGWVGVMSKHGVLRFGENALLNKEVLNVDFDDMPANVEYGGVKFIADVPYSDKGNTDIARISCIEQ